MSRTSYSCDASNPNWISCINSNYLYFGIGATFVGFLKQLQEQSVSLAVKRDENLLPQK